MLTASPTDIRTATAILTAARLRELLSYDPDTGTFTRLVRTGYFRAQAGAIAGSRRYNGYHIISVDAQRYYAHRLAWLYMTGEWPQAGIDHRDLDRSNNRWENLRAATQSQNLSNIGLPKHNTSGMKGVCWDRRRNCWMAKINHSGKTYFLGYFAERDAAQAAYASGATKIYGDFARTA
jgi:hypothetical protein